MKIYILILFACLCLTIFPQQLVNGKIAICFIERDIEKSSKVNFSPVSEGAFINQFTNAQFDINLQSPSPLISKETLEYSVMSTTGRLSALTGYVHLESGPDGSINFTSDKGQNLVLKSEVTSIHWLIDREKSIKLAKDQGYAYLLLAEIIPHNISDEINKNWQLSSQKSINIAMNLILLNIKTDKIVTSYSEDVTKMDAVINSAIKEGVKYLTPKFINTLIKEEK